MNFIRQVLDRFGTTYWEINSPSFVTVYNRVRGNETASEALDRWYHGLADAEEAKRRTRIKKVWRLGCPY